MIWLLFIINIFLTQVLMGTVGFSELWGKTWVSHHLALFFSPTLDGIQELEWYILQLLLWLLLWIVGPCHAPHMRAHVELGRAGFEFGWGVPTTCRHECSSVQRVFELQQFCFDFIFLFLLIIFGILSLLWPSNPDPLASIMNCMIVDEYGVEAVATTGYPNGL